MKKQFLILTVLTLFAGTFALGQALPGSAPFGHTCPNDALHPIAGMQYTYTANATPTGGNYQFWATTDQTFISTVAGVTTNNSGTALTAPAGGLINTSANYNTPNATNTVSLTWSDATLTAAATTPTFVAVQYSGTACADNFRAWLIEPVFAFTVDIRNIENGAGTPVGYGVTDDQCSDIVRGATYNTGTNHMDYNFGTQTLYYEVVAANFTGSWTPTFTLTGVTVPQTAVVEWTYESNPANWPTALWNAATTTVTTTEPTTVNGVSIYVRVTITNNNFEAINPETISLAVDGLNSVGAWDILNNDLTYTTPSCGVTTGADQADVAAQTINPRPNMNAAPTPAPYIAPNTIQN